MKKGLIIGGSIAVGALILWLILKPKKRKTGEKRVKKLKKKDCYNPEFWDGYYYNNPEKGPGQIKYRPVGDKVLLYRKDYAKKGGEWVWINPLNSKDIDTDLSPKSVAELEREEECLKNN